MRLQYLVIVALSLSRIYAQGISIAELHTIASNKNWETTNRILMAKGWEFNNSSQGDNVQYNVITWTFDRDRYSTDKERAKAWLTLYTYDGVPSKISYRFRMKPVYNSLRKQLSMHKYKLQDEEVRDQEVLAKYSNHSYISEITYERVEADEYSYEGSYTVYEFLISKKGGIYDPDNGKKKDYYESGALKAEYFLTDGKVNGKVLVYNEDGTLDASHTVVNGIRTGKSVEYIYKSPDSLLAKYSGEYLNDQKNSKWTIRVLDQDTEKELGFEHFQNGKRHGPFCSVAQDTVRYGNYSNDLLQGKFTSYIDLDRMISGGLVSIDTLKLKPIEIKWYNANLLHGPIKQQDLNGRTVLTGFYTDSLKTGTWEYYYPKISDTDGNELPFSHKQFLTEQYRLGLLHGGTIRTSYIQNVSIPCGKPEENECMTYTEIKVKEISLYQEGLLHGAYSLYDTENALVNSGNYILGKKQGNWMLRNESIVDPDRGRTVEKGGYINDIKQGEWLRLDDEAGMLERYEYKDGSLSGEYLSFKNNKIGQRRNFNNGQLNRLEVLDDAANVLFSYELSDLSSSGFNCQKTERTKTGIRSTGYKVLQDSETISPSDFNLSFEMLPGSVKILHGTYTLTGYDGRVLENGQYQSGKKMGIWESFFYQQGIRIDYTYDQYGNLITEFYYNLKKQKPLDGEFEYLNSETGLLEERRVRDGFRNGLTRYRDAEGKTVLKREYEDGRLRE